MKHPATGGTGGTLILAQVAQVQAQVAQIVQAQAQVAQILSQVELSFWNIGKPTIIET